VERNKNLGHKWKKNAMKVNDLMEGFCFNLNLQTEVFNFVAYSLISGLEKQQAESDVPSVLRELYRQYPIEMQRRMPGLKQGLYYMNMTLSGLLEGQTFASVNESSLFDYIFSKANSYSAKEGGNGINKYLLLFVNGFEIPVLCFLMQHRKHKSLYDVFILCLQEQKHLHQAVCDGNSQVFMIRSERILTASITQLQRLFISAVIRLRRDELWQKFNLPRFRAAIEPSIDDFQEMCELGTLFSLNKDPRLSKIFHGDDLYLSTSLKRLVQDSTFFSHCFLFYDEGSSKLSYVCRLKNDDMYVVFEMDDIGNVIMNVIRKDDKNEEEIKQEKQTVNKIIEWLVRRIHDKNE